MMVIHHRERHKSFVINTRKVDHDVVATLIHDIPTLLVWLRLQGHDIPTLGDLRHIRFRKHDYRP